MEFTMPWIQHYSRADIKNGKHPDPGTNTVLIQIRGGDDDYEFVKPKHRFVNTVKFEFDDVEDPTDPNCITDHDAKLIAKILVDSLEQDRNVIVHCYAGLCRSSAVAVVGYQLGFDLENKTRIPNTLVKKKLSQALGLWYDPTESPFNLEDPYFLLKDEDGN